MACCRRKQCMYKRYLGVMFLQYRLHTTKPCFLDYGRRQQCILMRYFFSLDEIRLYMNHCYFYSVDGNLQDETFTTEPMVCIVYEYHLCLCCGTDVNIIIIVLTLSQCATMDFIKRLVWSTLHVSIPNIYKVELTPCNNWKVFGQSLVYLSMAVHSFDFQGCIYKANDNVKYMRVT